MRRHLAFIVSAGLNFILAFALLSSRHEPQPAVAAAPAPPPATNTNLQRTQIVVRKQFFSWSDVESPDYRTYIAKLQEIGCPRQTIRDIVIADVNQLYARKRQTDIVTPDQQWWRSTPDTNVVQLAKAKLQALDQERRALLTSLLGPNWDSGNTENFAATLGGPVLGELSQQARESVQDILSRSQQRAQAYIDAQQKDGLGADPAQLAKIEQQTRDELGKVLTPAQLEEVSLRYSRNADVLRRQLTGLDVTPDEFRLLFHSVDSIAQQLQQVTGEDPGSVARRNALQKQLEDSYKQVLGPNRYQAYQLAQDPAYQDAVANAQQAGASPLVAQGLYRVNLATKQEQDRIRNDPTLTPDQKAEQLAAIEQVQKEASDKLLGVSPQPTPPMPPTPVATQVHAYSPGESLDIIAARYGVSVNAILNANPTLDMNHLNRGTPIKIPQ